jgi:hypothetical protein
VHGLHKVNQWRDGGVRRVMSLKSGQWSNVSHASANITHHVVLSSVDRDSSRLGAIDRIRA